MACMSADGGGGNAMEATPSARGPMTMPPLCSEEVRYCRCSHRCEGHPRRMHRLEFEAHAAEQSELKEIIREARRLGDRVQEREWEADHCPGHPEEGNGVEGSGAGGPRSGVKKEDGGSDEGAGDAKGAPLQTRTRPRAASIGARTRKRSRSWKTPRLLCRCETCLGKNGEHDKLVSETTWRRHNKARMDGLMQRLKGTASPSTKQAVPAVCESGVLGGGPRPDDPEWEEEQSEEMHEDLEGRDGDLEDRWYQGEEEEEWRCESKEAEEDRYAQRPGLSGASSEQGMTALKTWNMWEMLGRVSQEGAEEEAEEEGAGQQAHKQGLAQAVHHGPSSHCPISPSEEKPRLPIRAGTQGCQAGSHQLLADTPADVIPTPPDAPITTGLICPPIVNPSLVAAVAGKPPRAASCSSRVVPSLCPPKRQPAVVHEAAPDTPTGTDDEGVPGDALGALRAEVACGVPVVGPHGAASPDELVQAVKKVLEAHGAPPPFSRDLESALGLPPCSLAPPHGETPPSAAAATTKTPPPSPPLPATQPSGSPACDPPAGASSGAAPVSRDEGPCQMMPEATAKKRGAKDGSAVQADKVEMGDEERSLESMRPCQYRRKRVRALNT